MLWGNLRPYHRFWLVLKDPWSFWGVPCYCEVFWGFLKSFHPLWVVLKDLWWLWGFFDVMRSSEVLFLALSSSERFLNVRRCSKLFWGFLTYSEEFPSVLSSSQRSLKVVSVLWRYRLFCGILTGFACFWMIAKGSKALSNLLECFYVFSRFVLVWKFYWRFWAIL